MDSATQPILVCIGRSVGGRPTQFLMQRAFEAHGLEWQALSVEVKEDQLATALDGLAAMGIRGVRFFGSLQDTAADILDCSPSNELGIGLGPVSSLVATEAGWQAWHTDGLCLATLMPSDIAIEDCHLCLFDSSRTSRSIAAAITQNLLPVASASWIDGPELSEKTPADHSNVSDANTADSDSASLEITRYANSDAFLAQQLDVSQLPDQSTAPICLIGCEASVAEDLSQRLGARRCIWIGSSPRPASFPREDCITKTDLLVAGEAYDFHRWTDSTIDPALLRDAYDEYVAF